MIIIQSCKISLLHFKVNNTTFSTIIFIKNNHISFSLHSFITKKGKREKEVREMIEREMYDLVSFLFYFFL